MNNKGFTLIELIVGMSISMILMVSVGIFISSGMQNIFMQQKALENTNSFTNFAKNIYSSFETLDKSFQPIETNSGILFRRGQNFGDGGFTYIGTETLSGVYCKSDINDIESDPDNLETNSLYLKTFIPFEEQGEDLFVDYSEILISKDITLGTNTYRSVQNEHKIINISDNSIIVGKGIFGDKFTSGDNGTDIYLNSPTGLAKNSAGDILFISDTLNSRILYYDIATGNTYKLLDETDGLNEPTGLTFSNNTLYIANSGNGEILEYGSSSTGTNPSLILNGISQNSANKIEISFQNQDGTEKNITGPNNKTDILFSNLGKNSDYIGINNNTLQYYFVSYGSNSSIGTCASNEEELISGNPVRCISSGTGQTSSYVNKNFSSTDITINNIGGDFSANQNYYINLKLFNGTTEVLSKYFPYFTQSDNSIITPGDNYLKILYSGLIYPTGLNISGSQLEIYDSGDRRITDLNINTGGIIGDIVTLTQFSGNTQLHFHSSDKLLGTPISSLDILINGTNDLISFVLKYYKSYDCYNTDIKNEKTFLINKNLK